MANLAAPQRGLHECEISGLRGLALLIVVGGHFVQRIERFNPPDLPHARTIRLLIDSFASPAAGVYLFFAVSGYLIAQSLSRQTPFYSADLGCFYIRRAIRITLPYAFVLISTWLVLTICAWEPAGTHLYNVKPDSIFDSLLASLSYTHGMTYGTYPRLFPPGWTLEIEVQFYVLAPFLCFVFRHLTDRWGLGTASALAFGVTGSCALISLRSGLDRLQPTILVFMPLFVLGIVAYHVRQLGWRPVSRLTPILGWVALAAFITIQPWMSGIGVEIAVRMAFIAVMFSAVAARRGAFFRLCTHPILVGLGAVSYSIYLVHLQIIHFVAAAIAKHLGFLSLTQSIALNVAISAALLYVATKIFFRGIERPALLLSNIAASYGRRSLGDASR